MFFLKRQADKLASAFQHEVAKSKHIIQIAIKKETHSPFQAKTDQNHETKLKRFTRRLMFTFLKTRGTLNKQLKEMTLFQSYRPKNRCNVSSSVSAIVCYMKNKPTRRQEMMSYDLLANFCLAAAKELSEKGTFGHPATQHRLMTGPASCFC